MERGEIWLVSLDPTAGHEQRGRRADFRVKSGGRYDGSRFWLKIPLI